MCARVGCFRCCWKSYRPGENLEPVLNCSRCSADASYSESAVHIDMLTLIGRSIPAGLMPWSTAQAKTSSIMGARSLSSSCNMYDAMEPRNLCHELGGQALHDEDSERSPELQYNKLSMLRPRQMMLSTTSKNC